MTSENYRQLLNAERDSLEMTKEDFDNTLMHFAMLYHKEQLALSGVVYSKNGMNTPNPEKVHYTIWKFKDNDQEFQIDGRNLVYCQLGSTHHGCQSMHTGEKEEHKLITSKLKQVCDLLKEVDKLNKT